ncbi:ABC transporter substrate-binding protein [uncultured Shewanella sp.]|uniref:ABC transporter substrate-binding protein n=1 Tax=uncultured Shewanella sp. TaxID=173975 RepID=UPI0026047502|nr:helical backbone metal receptor [uncultured Shewanella sp.]
MRLLKILLLASLLLGPQFAFSADKQSLRIVSLAPNWSHTVAEIGAIDDLVGVTSYARFPAEVPLRVKQKRIAVVGGFTDITVDNVTRLNPDLVLTATSLQLGLKAKFEALGYSVIHMEESSLEEVYHKIDLLGDAIGHQAQADELVTSIRSELNEIAVHYRAQPSPKVYYEINYFYKCVPGKHSYMTELLKLVGATPIFAEREGIAPMVSWTEVVKANPDVILLPMWPDATGPIFQGPEAGSGTTTINEVKSREGAAKVNAVTNDAVRFIDSAVTKQAGPSIPQAAKLLAEAIYGPKQNK